MQLGVHMALWSSFKVKGSRGESEELWLASLWILLIIVQILQKSQSLLCESNMALCQISGKQKNIDQIKLLIILMADSKIKQSQKAKKQGLYVAIKSGKPEEYKRYIKDIKQLDGDAQIVVNQVLSQVLVEKKMKNPTWFLNSLNFYKELFIEAVMDYLTNQSLFSIQIHQQIVKICTYKPEIQNTHQRGKQYFVEVCKYQKTEQNEKALEKIGCNYVQFALEILQSTAEWFPVDYQNPKIPSFFSKQYKKLLAKKIEFPRKQAYQFIKKNDYQNFKLNYQSFIDSLDDQEPPQAAKNPSPANANKNNQNATSNSPSMIEIKNGLLTSKITTKPQEKKAANDPSMIAIDKSLLKTNQDHKSTKNNPTLDAKRSQNPKQASLIIGQVDSSMRKTSGFREEKPQTFQRSSSQSEEKQKMQPKQQEKKKNENQKIDKQKLEQKSKSNRVEKNDIKKEDLTRKDPSKVVEKKSPIEQNNALNIPILQPESNIPSSKIQLGKSKKHQQASTSFPLGQNNAITVEPKQQQIEDSKLKKQSQIIPPYSFNQKTITKQDNRSQDKIRRQTPKKMPRMQKPSLPSSPTQQYQRITERGLQNHQNNGNPNKRPRSMPKTERRHNLTKIDFYNNFTYTKPDQFVSRNVSPSKQLNKTLSYWANNRSKNPMSRQLQKSSSIAQVLNEMRLDQITIPFQAKYFQPVTMQMHNLRSQSLNLVNSGRSHDIFFSNRIVSCRLIKDIKNVFTLILQNITNDNIQIDYQDMKNVQYCKKIKILSWANRTQIGSYIVPKNGFMDIKFKFQTRDFNFRFLQFLLKINQKKEIIILPITLIDMCTIQKINPSELNKFSLKGSIINSQPYTLHDKQLPLFLGGFRFPSLETSRERKEKQLIIGSCSMTMQRIDQDDDGEVLINVIIRVTNWEERKIQISIVYQKRNQDCEIFAKIVMYHLKFLTKEPYK